MVLVLAALSRYALSWVTTILDKFPTGKSSCVWIFCSRHFALPNAEIIDKFSAVTVESLTGRVWTRCTSKLWNGKGVVARVTKTSFLDSVGSILFMDDVSCTINYQTAVRSRIFCKFELDDAEYFWGLKPKAQIVRACAREGTFARVISCLTKCPSHCPWSPAIQTSHGWLYSSSKY